MTVRNRECASNNKAFEGCLAQFGFVSASKVSWNSNLFPDRVWSGQKSGGESKVDPLILLP